MLSEYYEGFEEMEDIENEVIDSLFLQLSDVPVLRPCDGVEAPALDKVPEGPEPIDDPSTAQHAIPSPAQHAIPSPAQDAIPSPAQHDIPSPSQHTDFFGGIGLSPASRMPTSRIWSTRGVEEVVQKMEGLEKEVRDLKIDVGQQMEALKEEVRELKDLCQKGFRETMGNDKDPIVREPRERREPWWRRSPSWTSQGRGKRKAGRVDAEVLAKKFKTAGGTGKK